MNRLSWSILSDHLDRIHKSIMEQLVRILMDYDLEQIPFEEDIYLYFDSDNGEYEITTFTNPGGNSWLDDDHITLYTMRPENHPDYDGDDLIDFVNNADDWYIDLAESIFDQLKEEVAYELEWN